MGQAPEIKVRFVGVMTFLLFSEIDLVGCEEYCEVLHFFHISE